MFSTVYGMVQNNPLLKLIVVPKIPFKGCATDEKSGRGAHY